MNFTGLPFTIVKGVWDVFWRIWTYGVRIWDVWSDQDVFEVAELPNNSVWSNFRRSLVLEGGMENFASFSFFKNLVKGLEASVVDGDEFDFLIRFTFLLGRVGLIGLFLFEWWLGVLFLIFLWNQTYGQLYPIVNFLSDYSFRRCKSGIWNFIPYRIMDKMNGMRKQS